MTTHEDNEAIRKNLPPPPAASFYGHLADEQFRDYALAAVKAALERAEKARAQGEAEPVAWRRRYGEDQPWQYSASPSPQWAADHSRFEEEPLYATPESITQPPYPEDEVVGPCVCGSWPGGKCLKCEWKAESITQPEPAETWRDPDTGKSAPKPAPLTPEQARAKLMPETEPTQAQEARPLPYGQVTTHKQTGQQFFYRWPDLPYLDNASECVSVYLAASQPAQAQEAPALSEAARKVIDAWRVPGPPNFPERMYRAIKELDAALAAQSHPAPEAPSDKWHKFMETYPTERAPEAPAWVSVGDQLPKPYAPVLAFAGSICVASVLPRPPHQTPPALGWVVWPDDAETAPWLDVSHWMPLPEAPAGDKR